MDVAAAAGAEAGVRAAEIEGPATGKTPGPPGDGAGSGTSGTGTASGSGGGGGRTFGRRTTIRSRPGCAPLRRSVRPRESLTCRRTT